MKGEKIHELNYSNVESTLRIVYSNEDIEVVKGLDQNF
ncbi:hypothetical protein RV12_GL001069 [Enterococcus quebecensis]|nr:hypothetical protein RV12_GL001069 [Enterococcus quebecensis]